MEMRGADSGSFDMICAVPAFWVGLLYDSVALDAAVDFVSEWTSEDRQDLRDTVPKLALETPFRDGTVRDVASQLLELAKAGLRRRDRKKSFGARGG